MQVLNEMRLGIVSEKAKAMLESCHARWPKSPLSNDCMSVVNLQVLIKAVNKINKAHVHAFPASHRLQFAQVGLVLSK